MRKLFSTLILTLLVATLAPGQPLIKKALFTAPQQFATVLNGTDQYWGKAAPANFDLNGTEILSNPTFDANADGWQSSLTGVPLAYETTIKRTGGGSAKITADAATSIYVRLSTAIPNVSTNKFTWEAWVYVPAANVSKNLRVYLANQALSTTGFNQITSYTTLTGDTWTKMVINVKLPGTQTGINTIVQMENASAGDIFYVDDASLTPAYEAIWGGIIKTTATGVRTICVTGKSSSLRSSIFLNNNTPTVTISDGTTSVSATNTATVNDGRHHTLIATVSRTGNLTLYVDGVPGSGASITTVGAITVDSVYFGRGLTGNYFSGELAARQRVRYDIIPSDIVSIISRINATWKRSGLPKAYAGGTVVAHYNWRAQGTDISGNGNHLTPVASPPIIKIQP